ncbi:MAG: hypothetical protein JWQ50_2794 [Caballeronia mineralivorans]|nr:hypothetical protein [Caballeronia mineralivorans]
MKPARTMLGLLLRLIQTTSIPSNIFDIAHEVNDKSNSCNTSMVSTYFCRFANYEIYIQLEKLKKCQFGKIGNGFRQYLKAWEILTSR